MRKANQAVLAELVRHLPEEEFEILGVHLAGGRVDVRRRGRTHRLHFTDSVIGWYLRSGASAARRTFGLRRTPLEGAVLMLCLTLTEDFDTLAPGEMSPWEYDGDFEPGAARPD